jgi:hypothetical protein
VKRPVKVVTSLTAAVWVFTASASRSCGFEDPNGVHSARAMIDWAYPKSLHVTSAVWKAQRDGVIAVSKQRKPAASFLGSYGTARHLLRRLGERISPYLTDPAKPSISLVLIGPVLWTRYTASGPGREPQIHTAGPAKGDAVVVTDEPVIEALLKGQLTPHEAESRGLIRFYGAEANVQSVRSLLRLVRPREADKNSPS